MQKLTLTYAKPAVCMAKRFTIARRALSATAGRVCGRGAPARHGKPPGQHQRMGTPMVENDSGYKLGQRYATLSLVKAPSSIWKAAVSKPFAGGVPGPGY